MQILVSVSTVKVSAYLPHTRSLNGSTMLYLFVLIVNFFHSSARCGPFSTSLCLVISWCKIFPKIGGCNAIGCLIIVVEI